MIALFVLMRNGAGYKLTSSVIWTGENSMSKQNFSKLIFVELCLFKKQRNVCEKETDGL